MRETKDGVIGLLHEPESHLERARETLRSVFGYDSFRPLQQQIVESILAGQDAFVLMPTGGGKSLCYQLPALMLDGMTVVVSPLIALMKDQVDALTELGVPATFINSSLESSEIGQRQRAIARGDVKLLYVAPERFATSGFIHLLRTANVGFFAIDEAHCVSEWGHDFRPEYRSLRQLRELFPSAVVAAFTATATPRVQEDIRRQLGLEDAVAFQGSFNRPNLYYEVRQKHGAYDQILTYVRNRPGDSGIIYCHSRASTEQIASQLERDGIRARSYHGGMDGDDRRLAQEAFVRDNIQIVVATIAFGMGIDKPDVRFVIHYDLPKNLEGYYQESGRAGRDGEPSECILFYSAGDVQKHRYFIDEKPSDALRQSALQQLQWMADWAENRGCRRKSLLLYFDELFDGQSDPCCDNCRNPAEEVDYTIPAQMFLSCVKRTGERFGAAYVIDVLRGSKVERLLRFGHDRLSTYGIGKDRSKEEWQYLSRALVREGYARQAPDEYNAIKITERGYQVLFKGQQVLLPAAPVVVDPGAARRRSSEDTPNADLFEQLRALRKRLADDRGVPPYVVFPDTALRHMSAELPTTEAAFLRILGVGRRKAEEYGDAFIEVITSHVRRTGAQPAALPSRDMKPATTRHLSQTAMTTLSLFRGGDDLDEIAEDRGLALTTVEGHIAEAIEAGQLTNIDRLVPPDRQEAIAKVIRRVGDELLRPIMDELGEGYSYTEIRFVRGALRARQTET